MLPGALAGSQPELAGLGRRLWRLLPVMVIGACAGAALLLSTPPGVFERIVPALVLAGVAALLLEPRISARRSSRDGHRPWTLPVAMGAISLYAGYFGAGCGVMALAALLILAERRLLIANAMKNVLVGAATLPPAIIFAAFGPVRWAAAVPLAIGILLGSAVGPAVARRLPPRLVRAAIAVIGVALAVELVLNP